MMGPTPLRDILLVTGYEVREMLRTRRALVLIALYLLAGLVIAHVFIEVIGKLEQAAAEALGTSAGTRPGAMTNHLLKDPTYRKRVMALFPNQQIAEYLLQFPPIVLMYAWSSFQFVPFLIVITASDTVAQETQNRGVRFTALRTGRLEFVTGKMLGQALLMAIVTLLTGGMFLLVAARGLQDFEWLPALLGILQFWPRVVAYSFAFVGLTALFTASASSANLARAFAVLGLILAGVLNGVVDIYRGGSFGRFWEGLEFLLPYVHRDDLWHYDPRVLVGSALTLVGLGAFYLVGGVLLFSRRDL